MKSGAGVLDVRFTGSGSWKKEQLQGQDGSGMHGQDGSATHGQDGPGMHGQDGFGMHGQDAHATTRRLLTDALRDSNQDLCCLMI